MPKIILIILILSAITAFFLFGGTQYLSFSYLKDQQATLQEYSQDHPWSVAATYFVIYVVVTALSLPGAAIMTLAGGALLGFWVGLITVSFASTIGASLAFIIARYLAGNWVRERYASTLRAIDEGVEKEGAFYLFALRLVPAFPFFLINIVMAITPIKIITFYIVSQLGMLAGTAVYVYAGTQLASLETPSDILSPSLLIAFTLLGLFPLAAKYVVKWLRG